MHWGDSNLCCMYQSGSAFEFTMRCLCIVHRNSSERPSSGSLLSRRRAPSLDTIQTGLKKIPCHHLLSPSMRERSYPVLFAPTWRGIWQWNRSDRQLTTRPPGPVETTSRLANDTVLGTRYGSHSWPASMLFSAFGGNETHQAPDSPAQTIHPRAHKHSVVVLHHLYSVYHYVWRLDYLCSYLPSALNNEATILYVYFNRARCQ